MKNFLFILLSSLLLTSCDIVGFKNPIPQNSKNIIEYPLNLRGKFLITQSIFDQTDTDTITIGNNYIFYNGKNAKDNKPAYLSDTLVNVRQFENFYIYNYKAANYWSVYLMKPLKNGDIAVLIIFTLDKNLEAFYKNLNEITPLTKNKTVKSMVEYIIAPTNKQLKTIIEHHFFKQLLVLSRIK